MSDSETATRERYAKAAEAPEAALCCPVDYNPKFLEVIPEEVIEKDYGCGDPSQHLKAGETVLDLGSGTGKICFIASQVVGPKGKVIGVDMTDEMLEVANRNAPIVAEQIGYANVEFRKGQIQELKKAGIQDDSIDTVVSNCVLNLVDNAEKEKLFGELYRVLKNGGRAVISDIISDREVPKAMQDDPELWSGCISGAMTRKAFLMAFVGAGFDNVATLKLDQTPWQTIEGINFHAITVEATKGASGDCCGDSGCC
ncbi:methyltransferase domain-containing protein [Rubellicoccus peritrichatus]|uniref:Arsenite methyltransferase n=1 Tax=Rubellicoccus peritrichatus TaxID=3080537 RepID=A0AAQ3L6M4_9BACT|nr:methyltransferase domain-containing protein [Puniceicoccus sp. CR14]WOO39627.1 methyltransferase domain-containing protein [Puniceicoccus sp. CR14]